MSAERAKEIAVAILAYLPNSAEDTKRDELAKADTDEDKVNQARSDLTVLTQGFSFAVAHLVVSYFNYDSLKQSAQRARITSLRGSTAC